MLLTITLIGLPAGIYNFAGWLVIPLAFVGGGLGLLRAWLLAHDAGHRALVNNKVLNNLLGSIFAAPTLYPFSALARAHAYHHCFLNDADLDTTWRPWTRKAYEKKSGLEKFLYRAVRHKMWFLGSFFHLLIFHFWTEEIKLRNTAKVILEKAVSLALLVFLFGVFLFKPKFFLAVILIQYLGFHFFLSTISYIQHSFPAFSDDKKTAKYWDLTSKNETKRVSPQEVALRTIDWRFPKWFEFLIMYINLHTVHHAFPHLPFYRLPAYSQKLRRTIAIDMRIFRLKDLLAVIDNCHFVNEPNKDGTLLWYTRNRIAP